MKQNVDWIKTVIKRGLLLNDRITDSNEENSLKDIQNKGTKRTVSKTYMKQVST